MLINDKQDFVVLSQFCQSTSIGPPSWCNGLTVPSDVRGPCSRSWPPDTKWDNERVVTLYHRTSRDTFSVGIHSRHLFQTQFSFPLNTQSGTNETQTRSDTQKHDEPRTLNPLWIPVFTFLSGIPELFFCL